jgi:hypothetical protein
MRKSKFTESQIIKAIKANENGQRVFWIMVIWFIGVINLRFTRQQLVLTLVIYQD